MPSHPLGYGSMLPEGATIQFNTGNIKSSLQDYDDKVPMYFKLKGAEHPLVICKSYPLAIRK